MKILNPSTGTNRKITERSFGVAHKICDRVFGKRYEQKNKEAMELNRSCGSRNSRKT